MPYRWNDELKDEGKTRQLALWPHRSLPRWGFAAFILITVGMISLPLFSVLGTAVLWGMLPFLLIAVAAIWFALEASYKSGTLEEQLTIDPESVVLRRRNPRGPVQEWDCQSYWAKVQMHETGGPVPHYVTLQGKGREVEIGAFLSEDERKALYSELLEAFRAVALPQPHPST
ncbi:MAG: DUF2244 domain-containing protein [Pseudomonadota bacterium]